MGRSAPAKSRCLGRAGLALVALWLAAGCTEMNAELFIANRPVVTNGGVGHYSVHVGDKPSLCFRTKFWTCDYAILHDETADLYDDCGPSLEGEFVWPHAFMKPTSPERSIRLTVTGYRQDGLRDHMPIRGRLDKAEPTGDASDTLVARATLLVTVEQLHVSITVSLPSGEPDWPLSRLVLTGRQGRKTKIRHGGSAAREGCFSVEGPDEAGSYRVTYTPKFEEINPAGPTQVELVVADAKGRTKTFSQLLGGP